jgi:putative ABC transport system substrate-binding protein
MDRRTFITMVGGSLFAAPLTVEAQQAGRVPRIGALGGGEGADSSPGWAGFRQGLRELGWEEGRNIAVEFRFTGGRDERYQELAEKLVRLNVDVLAASDSQAVRVAKEATGTIPIVTMNERRYLSARTRTLWCLGGHEDLDRASDRCSRVFRSDHDQHGRAS